MTAVNDWCQSPELAYSVHATHEGEIVGYFQIKSRKRKSQVSTIIYVMVFQPFNCCGMNLV
jgi:hypothetical protein